VAAAAATTWQPVSIDDDDTITIGIDGNVADNDEDDDDDDDDDDGITNETGVCAVLQSYVPKFGGARRLFCFLVPTLATLYFGCNYIWYQALPLTTVSSSNAIFQSQSVFVFVFSCIILHERTQLLRKSVAVLICMAGIFIIAVADHRRGVDDDSDLAFNGRKRVLGDVLMVLTTSLWGFYDVVYKKLVGESSRIKSPEVFFFMGLVGAFHFLCLWPGMLVLNYAGVESFRLPTRAEMPYVFGNGALGASFNVIFMLALTIASPLLVSMSAMLTIPLTYAWDGLIYHDAITWLSVVGSVVIACGFCLLNYVYFKEARRDKNDQERVRLLLLPE
jgi:solute carrier family 35 protein F5